MVDRRESNDADEGILTPEDIRVEDRDEVKPLGENRFVVSAGDGDAEAAEHPEDEGGERTRDGKSPDASSPADVPGEPAERTPLGAVAEQYGIDVRIKVDDDVRTDRITSDNIVEVFEELLLAYANSVDESTSADEVLRILLAESDLDVSILG